MDDFPVSPLPPSLPPSPFRNLHIIREEGYGIRCAASFLRLPLRDLHGTEDEDDGGGSNEVGGGGI
jgi:hypothetical protein